MEAVSSHMLPTPSLTCKLNPASPAFTPTHTNRRNYIHLLYKQQQCTHNQHTRKQHTMNEPFFCFKKSFYSENPLTPPTINESHTTHSQMNETQPHIHMNEKLKNISLSPINIHNTNTNFSLSTIQLYHQLI